jgi:hypothetical protein
MESSGSISGSKAAINPISKKLPTLDAQSIADRKANPDPVTAKQAERASDKVEARKEEGVEERRAETYSVDRKMIA